MHRLPIILVLSSALAGNYSKSGISQELRAKKLRTSLIDSQALTIFGRYGQTANGKSFQQDAMVTRLGFQYLAYYDHRRHVCVARRRLPDGPWQVVRLTDYVFEGDDSHNAISIGICPQDGTIHLAFDHHVHPLHYRVSQPGVATTPEQIEWTTELFGPVKSELEKDKPIRITYPRFWQTPEGGLQFCYRRGSSGNGDRMLVDYDPDSGQWKATRQIDSRQGRFTDEFGDDSNRRCSYPNGYHYGPQGNLHVTWVWREASQGANHDLMYAYSADRGHTWRNNLGQVLAEPPRLNSPNIKVARINRGLGLLNTHGQAVDSAGRIHAVIKHCTGTTLQLAGSEPGQKRWGPVEARRYFHYWRDENAQWQRIQLPNLNGVPGNRPKLFFDTDDNAILIFTDAPSSRGIQPSQGNLKIMAATATKNWNDWRLIHTEQGPFVNEMLGDSYRWRNEAILSIMVQDLPNQPHEPTPLRVLDFKFE